VECREARRLMHEILDQRDPDAGEIEEHLAACEECRAAFGRLRDADAATRAIVAESVDEDRASRAVAAALKAIAATPAAPARGRRLALAGLPFAVGLAMFAVGLWCGRTAWPREVTLTRVETRPETVERVVEKVVRVEVPVPTPVIRERVVVRTVYVPTRATAERRVAAGPITVPPIPRPIVTREITPAAVVAPPPEPAPPSDSREPATGLRADPTEPLALAQATLAGLDVLN
jgi:anti-sigma factor RsiW